MTDKLTQLSLQRDLCFSIDLDSKLKPMLETFSRTCIQLLELNAIHIYLDTQAIPQALLADLNDVAAPLAHFLTTPTTPGTKQPHAYDNIRQKLSQVASFATSSYGAVAQTHQHLFQLANTGVIVLSSHEKKLNHSLHDALLPVMAHLAKACSHAIRSEHTINTHNDQPPVNKSTSNQSPFDSLFENFTDGIVVINDQGVIKSINPVLLNTFGYSKHELAGQHIDLFMPPHFKQSHSHSIQRYIQAGSDARIVDKGVIELSAMRKSGDIFPVEISISEIFFDNTTHFLGIIRDISARHNNEEKLQRSHQHISNLLENSTDVFLLLNNDGQIIYLNTRAEELFGRRREELTQERISDVLPGLAHHFHNILHSVNDQPSPRAQESVYPMLGRWFESRAFTTSEGLGIYLHDITTQKKTEEAMRKARDSALASARAKSQFLANMSHEIRTPMNGVLGMLDLLRESELDKDQQTFAETAHRSAESLLTLLNDILDISKVEAGKLSLETLSVEIPALIRDSLLLPSQQAQKKNLSLTQDIADDVPTILQADPTRLRQILNNLLNNAIKFTHEGGVNVRLTRLPPDSSSALALIKFEIIDTGVGIPEEHQQNIFQLFTQADGSTTRKYGGTGLGLAICQRLIEAMGGSIGVESVPDQGSCFYFTLPEIPADI